MFHKLSTKEPQNNMKKILITMVAIAISTIAFAGQDRQVKTDAGTRISVQACDNGIFRIKVSPRKDFGESLMERYGCIKTDWPEVNATESTKGSEWTLTSGDYSLTVNKKTGAISVRDSKGRALVRDIRFLSDKDKLTANL